MQKFRARAGIAAAALSVVMVVTGCAAGDLRAGVNTAAYVWTNSPPAVNQAISDLGVGWVRFWQPWAQVNPADGTYDFSRIKPQIDDLNARGLRVLVTFVSVPAWARRAKQADDRSFNAANCFAADYTNEKSADGKDPTPTDGGPGTPPRPGVFGTFVRKFATTFNGKVQAFDLWNEPSTDGGCWWAGSKADFRNRIMIEGFDAAKAVDPSVLVGGSGAPHLSEKGSPAGDVDGWLTYNNGTRDVMARDFDFFSFHVYADADTIVKRFNDQDSFQRCNWNKSFCQSTYMLTEFGFQRGHGAYSGTSGGQADPGASAVTVIDSCKRRAKCRTAFIWDIWRPDPVDGGYSDFCMLKGPGPVFGVCDNKYQRVRDYLKPH